MFGDSAILREQSSPRLCRGEPPLRYGSRPRGGRFPPSLAGEGGRMQAPDVCLASMSQPTVAPRPAKPVRATPGTSVSGLSGGESPPAPRRSNADLSSSFRWPHAHPIQRVRTKAKNPRSPQGEDSNSLWLVVRSRPNYLVISRLRSRLAKKCR
jgi:hypothetical protein